MKRLSDQDISNMINDIFVPDDVTTRKNVRKELKLSTRIPVTTDQLPKHVTLDLHLRTEEQAWNEIMELATSGIKSATIITGASGILRKKFPQWVCESILSPYITTATPINNGSFDVKFKKIKS